MLAHRSPNKHAYPGVWDLPGGDIEAGESELGALARELHEELDVQIAAGSASHLCRLIARPAEEPVRLSAWHCVNGKGRQRTSLPRNMTTSNGSILRSCLLSPMNLCARPW